ncbi:hypothetical protein [Alishewanella tabrizica]|uniref:hypothetical protein n=1 Tax=Alishewanella tabrizica TaxID=671278 RepID=UPI0016786AB0|nr:hypothetical protein [Alishewanella tabrizica]
MKQSSSKKTFIQTIGYAPWILAIFTVIFLVMSFFERPIYFLLFLSIPYGLYTALVLPFLWRRNNDWLGGFLTVVPIVFFINSYGNHFAGIQAACATAAFTSFIWLSFKSKFIGYVSNNT